jgi:hypothetical protein
MRSVISPGIAHLRARLQRGIHPDDRSRDDARVLPILWWIVACLAVDLAALSAHLLELPNELALPGDLWLAVQQRLYRGWGPVLGPFEVGAVAATWVLVAVARGRPGGGRVLVAAVCLAVSLYRWRWELGHAARAALTVSALTLLLTSAVRAALHGTPARRPVARRRAA